MRGKLSYQIFRVTNGINNKIYNQTYPANEEGYREAIISGHQIANFWKDESYELRVIFHGNSRGEDREMAIYRWEGRS